MHQGAEEGGEEDAAGAAAEEGGDPYANMSARQRKLHNLRLKLGQSRKANQAAVIAEKKREKVGRW